MNDDPPPPPPNPIERMVAGRDPIKVALVMLFLLLPLLLAPLGVAVLLIWVL